MGSRDIDPADSFEQNEEWLVKGVVKEAGEDDDDTVGLQELDFDPFF
jgi:hypothetical protein